MGDRRYQRLAESDGLFDGLLEMDAGLGQAAELREECAEVDVDSCLTELVRGAAQHLEGRLVGGQRGIELTLLVEDHPTLEVGVSERGAAHRRLGDVEDRQRVGQLALIRDDQRQGGGDAPGQHQVVQGGRRLPCPLEVGARRRAGRPARGGPCRAPNGRSLESESSSAATEHRQRAARGRRWDRRCTARTSASAAPRPDPGIDLGAYGPRSSLTLAAIMQGWTRCLNLRCWISMAHSGAYEEAFGRRRIAAAMDERGRVTLGPPALPS